MRLAIVAASSYEENGQVARIPNAELDVELFGSRLAEADADFVVHAFPAERGLGEAIDDLLKSIGERPRALIFYFWGYALLSEGHAPTLLLDGPKLAPLSLARLRRQLSEAADVSLVVLDTTLAAGSLGAPLEAVRAMGGALSSGDSTVSSLIAVHMPTPRKAKGPPPFTGLVQMILDAQTGNATALTPETLFRAMQAEEVMFADIPAAGCFLGSRDFALVPGVASQSVLPAASDYEEMDELTDEVTAPRAAPAPPARPRSYFPPPPPPPPVRKPALEIVPAADAPVPHVAPSTAGEHCRRILNESVRTGNHDRAYRAAVCLEVLGEADINESLLVTTHRPEALQSVRGALSYADWHERLCSGCDEPRTTAVLRALGPALARVGFQQARRMRREVPLPDEARQDPEKSTTMLAKTLYWTSRLLCVPAQSLYVLPELSGTLGLVPGPEAPLVACERTLGSGFTLPELVCLWARELSYARPEQAALVYFPNAAELTQLLLAALALGGAASMRAIDGDAKRLASLLKREVRGAALDALRAAAGAFPVREVNLRVAGFIRAAELVAGRVALVACGDLELVLAQDQRFPRGRLTRPEERRADLLRFTIGSDYGQIRVGLGVALS